VAYPFQWGARCKKLIAASQSAGSKNWLAAIHVDRGNKFSRCNSNNLVAGCQFPLPANSGKPFATKDHRTSLQQEMRENYQAFFSILCSGHPMDRNGHLFFEHASETGFSI
jgi:hypothetical protein